ncbi:hypothetical protein LINPERHAP2_LOCUS37501 [Linum perenne]
MNITLLSTVSSSDNNLEGLVDSEDPSLSRTKSISSEELDFLRDLLLKADSSSTNADGQQLRTAGKLKDEAFMVVDVISSVNDQFVYNPFVRSQRNRQLPPTYLELHGLLLAEEQDIAGDELTGPQAHFTRPSSQPQRRYSRQGRQRTSSGSDMGRGSVLGPPPHQAGRAPSQYAGLSQGRGPQFSCTPQGRGPQSTYTPQGRQLICYNCQGLGHHFRACPSPR